MQALSNQYEFDHQFQNLREKGLVYDDEDGNHKFVETFEEHSLSAPQMFLNIPFASMTPHGV